MEVRVAPLPDIKKWHGKKGKEDFTQPKTIEALVDPETGRYKIELSEERAEQLAKILSINLDTIFIPDEAHPFFSSKAAEIKLPNHPIVFNTKKPLDEVKVAILKADKRVANSMVEYNKGEWPEATHVIHDEAQEAELKATKIQKRNRAINLLSDMSEEARIAMVQVINNKNLKGRSPNFIDVEMDDIIENNIDQFLMYVQLGKEEVMIRAQVGELLSKNILTKEGNAVFYMGDQIALNEDEAVKWFKDPNNSKQKVFILDKLSK